MEKVWNIQILYPQGSCGYFHSWDRGAPLIVFNDDLACVYTDLDEATEDYERIEALSLNFEASIEPIQRVSRFPSQPFDIVVGANLQAAAE